MRPNDLDQIFHALADANRRKMLDIVKERPGCNVTDVAAEFGVSRIAVMKHLKVLEDADLIRSRRDGRNRRLYLNVVPIQMIYDRWTSEWSSLWASGLTRLKYELEGENKNNDDGE